MANINVTYDQMIASADRLRAGKSDIEGALQSLRQLVAHLVQDGFSTSAASGAFDAAYEEFTAGARHAIEGIEGMALFLTRAADILRSTDEQLAGQFRQ